MSDIFDGVAQTMGVVIGGVYAPLFPSAWVRGSLDPVGHWINLAIS